MVLKKALERLSVLSNAEDAISLRKKGFTYDATLVGCGVGEELARCF